MDKEAKLVSAFYEKIPASAIDNKYTKGVVKELLQGYGVYALYSDDKLYYIGKGDLYYRIKEHYKRDHHVGKCNIIFSRRYTYIIP